MKCFNCGTEIELDRKVFRQDVCPNCDIYLHCCLNCRFYDKLAAHECKESQARWARDKEAANFCDYFEPGQVVAKRITSKQDDARQKLDELFKKEKKE